MTQTRDRDRRGCNNSAGTVAATPLRKHHQLAERQRYMSFRAVVCVRFRECSEQCNTSLRQQTVSDEV